MSSPVPPCCPQGTAALAQPPGARPCLAPTSCLLLSGTNLSHQPVSSLLTLIPSCFHNLPGVHLFQAGPARQC